MLIKILKFKKKGKKELILKCLLHNVVYVYYIIYNYCIT